MAVLYPTAFAMALALVPKRRKLLRTMDLRAHAGAVGVYQVVILFGCGLEAHTLLAGSVSTRPTV